MAIKSTLKVVLKSDAQKLDEVMVVAYGTTKKRHLQVLLLPLRATRP